MTVDKQPWQCMRCKHFKGAVWQEGRYKYVYVCEAYPQGIPEAIVSGTVSHERPYPGDRGYRYERHPDGIRYGLRLLMKGSVND